MLLGDWSINKIYPEWFGARTNDNTFDDRPAVQLCNEISKNLGGITVELSTGEYYINSRIPTKDYCLEMYSNGLLIGPGMFLGNLKVGDDVDIDTPLILTNSANNVMICSLGIAGNKARLDPSSWGIGEDEGIDIKGGKRITLRDVYIHDCATDGIDLDKVNGVGSHVEIQHCLILHNEGVGVHNAFDYSNLSHSTIEGNGFGRFNNNTGQVKFDACGVDIKGDNSTINYCKILSNVVGVNIAGVQSPSINNNTIDGSQIANIVVGSVIADTGPIRGDISDNKIKNSVLGIKFRSNQQSFDIDSNYIQSIGGNSYTIDIYDASGLNINDNTHVGAFGIQVMNASGMVTIDDREFQTTNSGIRVLPSASGNVTIKGNTDSASVGVGFVDLRGPCSGIKILNNISQGRPCVRMLNFGGFPTNCTIKNNKDLSMTIGGTGHTIKNNTGYITENSGNGVIANGDSTVVITHGLSVTPDKIICFGDSSENLWYSNITPTTFQVNKILTTGVVNFSWSAEL